MSQAEPWSIFTQGGGNGAAVTWAQDLLAQIGAPQTPGNIQFVYDWEKSEGGGGQYNPLNQGPVPGQPQLTFTGSQYGGGAAGYVSVAAGLQGAADYLNMPDYAQVKAALLANNPAGAEQALWASPWAGSHYGYGSAWNASPLPGQASAIVETSALSSVGGAVSSAAGAVGGAVATVAGDAVSGTVGQIVTSIVSPVETWILRIIIGLFAVAFIVAALVLAARHSDTGKDAENAAGTAAVAALA